MGLDSIEWLAQHLNGPKVANYEQQFVDGGEKDIPAWEVRCACFASMETDLEKALAALLVWGHKEQNAYDYVRKHLANSMIKEAQKKNLYPKNISLKSLAWLVARMVIEFALDPELEEIYTKKGRLYFAGIKAHQMTCDAYRKTWREFEIIMELILVTTHHNICSLIEKYRRELKKAA